MNKFVSSQKLFPKTLDMKRKIWHSIKAVKKDNRVTPNVTSRSCPLTQCHVNVVPLGNKSPRQ